MTIEASIFATLKTLVANRVYRDVAPQNVTALPRITFSQIGGDAVNFLDQARPSKKNARIQISCWGSDRDSVAALARSVEDALRAANSAGVTQTVVLSGMMAVYEPDTKLYGAHQDFSIWKDN